MCPGVFAHVKFMWFFSPQIVH